MRWWWSSAVFGAAGWLVASAVLGATIGDRPWEESLIYGAIGAAAFLIVGLPLGLTRYRRWLVEAGRPRAQPPT